MGQPKLLLPLGGQTILERVINTTRLAGIDNILVVATARVPSLEKVAANAGAAVAVLDDETPDMRATVEAGLQWLEHHCSPAPSDGWLLIPADHPVLEVQVIRNLLTAERNSPQHSIFVPTSDGKRGHPTLVRWQHVATIRSFPPGHGLNEYFRAHASQTIEISVDSPNILCDLDTPEDYARLLQRVSFR